MAQMNTLRRRHAAIWSPDNPVRLCPLGSRLGDRMAVPVERTHNTDASKHRRTIMLDHQQQRFHRGLPGSSSSRFGSFVM
jgi:hypothetical protein